MNDIHLNDLANPQFDDATAAIIELVRPLADSVELAPNTLMRQASNELGLDDFGVGLAGGDYLGHLSALCEALEAEAGLSAIGRVSLQAQLLQLLKNRLLLVETIDRHPEIQQVPIDRPIFIVGQPRTGTTHLHNLLAADDRLRYLPYWQSIEPFRYPPEGSQDGRRARCELGLAFLHSAAPHIDAMHEMTVEHAHEEIALLAMNFSTVLFETLAPVPSYRDHYLATDQTPSYQYLKLVLQALTLLDPGSNQPARWVLKSPQHLEQIPAIKEVFPDAILVITHRDPYSVSVSLSTMLAYLRRLQCDSIDLRALGAYWDSRNYDFLSACLRDRDLFGPDQAIDVQFNTLMESAEPTLERIYKLAGLAFDTTAQSSLGNYLKTHQRNRHGRVIYQPELFGLKPEATYELNSDYIAAFDVVREH